MTEKRLMWEGPNGVAERVVLVDLNGDPVAPSGGGGGGGGGGGSGDASAAHQVTQIARLDTLITQTDGLESAIGLLATAAQMAALLAQTDGVESALGNIDSKTPALSGGKVPVIDTESRDLSQAIADRLGAAGDAAADSDVATASQIAIAKRHNVLLSALAKTPSDLVLDSAGTAFSPSSCSHTYSYDGSGNLTTDTATLGLVVRVRTYTYTAGTLTAASQWVVR